MGVKLGSLIEETDIDLADLAGKKVAVDGMQMLFQLLNNPFYAKRSSSSGNPGKFEVDASRRVYYHLYGWIQKAMYFYKAQILPLVVFDGKPSRYKMLYHRRSEAIYKKAQNNYWEAIKTGDYLRAQKIALSKHYMLSRCIRESLVLLKSCGIPAIVAPGEAEAQCAIMQKKGMVDYAVSTDYDAILYGATAIVRSITFQTRKKVNGKWKTVQPKASFVDVPANLKRLNLGRKDLVEMSFLLGNDYFKGIPNVGPVTAQKAIKTYGTIPAMKIAHPRLFRNLHHSIYRKIRTEFLRPKFKEDTKEIEFGDISADRVKFLMLHEHGLNEKRVLSALRRLEKARKKAAKNPALMFAHNPLVKRSTLTKFKGGFLPSKNKEKIVSFGAEEYGAEHLGITPGPWLQDNLEDLPSLKHGEHRYNDFLRRRLEKIKSTTRAPKNVPMDFFKASELEDDEKRNVKVCSEKESIGKKERTRKLKK